MGKCMFECGRLAPVGERLCDQCDEKLRPFSRPMSFEEFGRNVMRLVDDFERAGGRYSNLTGTGARW